MWLARKAALLLVGAIVLLAPIACVRFCQLQSVPMRRSSAAWLAEIPRLHALRLDEREAQQSHHHTGDHHAPLSRIRQLVLSVTEFVLTQYEWPGVVIVGLWMMLLMLRPAQPLLLVPEPPPRRLVYAP
jgi:hypothetical protein